MSLDLPDCIGVVSHETHQKLVLYYNLLIKWQGKINLISPGTVSDAWQRHFVDSAQLSPLFPSGVGRLYDLGSGAGFAGMVLAILRPDIHVFLIESDAKKCAFLSAVSRETGVLVTVCNERIETAQKPLPPPDAVSARALASLRDLLSYSFPWALKNPDMCMVFPKGAQFQVEIEAARQAGWLFDCEENQSKTDVSGRILTITNLRKAESA